MHANMEVYLSGEQIRDDAVAVIEATEGVADGIATLDADGKLTGTQVPDISITDTYVVASEVAQLAIDPIQIGDVAVRTDTNKCYINTTGSNASMADWQELLTPTDLVLSVAGKVGHVTLVAADLIDVTATAAELNYTDGVSAPIQGQLNSKIASVAADSTPQLGGNLDVNGYSIVSESNGDITLTPNGTGEVTSGANTLNVGDGADTDKIITAYNGDVNLPRLRYLAGSNKWQFSNDGSLFVDFSSSTSGLTAIVNDATPQLGGDLDPNGFDVGDLTEAEITALHDFISTDWIVGVKWETASSSPTLIRINELDDTLSDSILYFNRHPIYSRIKRCNVADDGTINAYHGESSFAYDGTNGQVMVYVPKFYYRSYKVGTIIRYLISPVVRNGFKIHPAFVVDSVEKDYFLLGSFPGCAYDVTGAATEVDTIEILTEPTANGNLTLYLDEDYSFTVAILNVDTIEDIIDKIVAAGVKTDNQSITWTPLKVDASHVSYTAGNSGLKTTITMPNILGVTSTIVKTTPGAGGYVLNDSDGVDFTGTTGDKLSSVAGIKPISGNQNTLTRANARILAENRGTGWQLFDFNQLSALQLLFMTEYATLNSQSIFEGVTDLASGLGNEAINTGYTAGVGAGSLDLGNTSGEVSVLATQPFSYRGIENWYGLIWQWIDGINIKEDYNPWIADHDYIDDTFAAPYVDTGLTLVAANGFVSAIEFDSVNDFAFLASAVAGSSSTYLCDYYFQATGNRVAKFGGGWNSKTDAGAFVLHLTDSSARAYLAFGARIVYVPQEA